MNARTYATAGVIAVIMAGAVLAVQSMPSSPSAGRNRSAGMLAICDQARSAGQLTPDCNRKVSQAIASCDGGSVDSICADPRLTSYGSTLAASRIGDLATANATYFSGWKDYAANAGYEVLYPPRWQVRDAGSVLDIVPPEGKGYFRIIQAPSNASSTPQYNAELRTALFEGPNASDAKVIQNASTYNGQYLIPETVYSVNVTGLRHIAFQWTVNDGGGREYSMVFTGPHEISLRYATVANAMVETMRFDSGLPSQCHSVNGLPDPRCTPGEADPAVTQDNIGSTICVPGYTEKVRPPVSVTEPMKLSSMKSYGDSDSPSHYEYDHLIPLELGGASTIKNLWPEPLAGQYNAHAKDTVENILKKGVCAGQISLADAQHEIAVNWTAVYVNHYGNMQVPGQTGSNRCPGTTIPLGNGGCLDPGNYLG